SASGPSVAYRRSSIANTFIAVISFLLFYFLCFILCGAIPARYCASSRARPHAAGIAVPVID
ncbi:MAG TPA: hypothetical protein VIL85_07675, partial [Thermomicrobiales bacterium]